MPVAGLIHEEGKVASAALFDVVGSPPESVCCVVVPSGVYAISQELAGTERPLAVVVTAADGLIAISTGTMTPDREVADWLSSVRPGPRLLIVPFWMLPPSDWLYVVAVVPWMK